MYLVISWKYILIFVGLFFLLLVQNTFCYLSEIYFVICWKYILLLPSPAPLKACNIFAAQFLYGRLWGIYSMMTDMTMKIMNVMMAVINIMMVTINQNDLNYDGDTDEDGDAAVAAAADDDDAVALALAAVDDDDDDDDDEAYLHGLHLKLGKDLLCAPEYFIINSTTTTIATIVTTVTTSISTITTIIKII